MDREEEKNLDELALELRNDEYPLPEGRDKDPLPKEKEEKQVTYRDVDVTVTFKKESKKDAVTDERRVLFTDSGFGVNELLYDEVRKVLRVPIVLAKEMIYHYDDYDAFRPKDELKAIASYIKGVPVTRGHPEEKIVTDREEVLGWAIDAEFEDDELRAVLEISDKSLIEDIQLGKLRDVSPGHFSRLDKTASGEYEGTRYDVTQRDIFIDHIAIVETGRCNAEDGCGVVLDEEVKEKKDKKKEEGDEKKIMKGILSKLNTVLKLAEKLGDETLTKKLEDLKKAIEEEEEKGEKKEGGDEKKDKYPLPGEKKGEGDAVDDEAMKKIEAERDELKTELDEIVSVEKEKLIDELSSLQDVKSEDKLKEMSLDSLKSDLELVKALKGSKFTVDDEGRGEGGSGAIKSAYKEVGRKGDKG